ncbi:zinc ribbon domain-containing protein [uncultured Phascolarctobacterium sp.]|uniref:zinc ribbon domain-containing protein n=1 Tax=uncultured Phascolarctobacterium sp. TaxID=512296 RepID=UPI0025D4A564|nr:zinc ribbon domain-containing protein [uncultured Phascolarctobacterium sp.]
MGFLIFIVFCVAVGMFAQKKGRSALGWGLASLLISPLLAGIILALVKDLSQEEAVNKVEMEQQDVKERIAVNEVQINQRFQHVEKEISSIKQEVGMLDSGSQAKTQMLEEGMKKCPHCGESIKSSAVKCRYCGSVLESIPMRECPFCKELIRADATKCRFCRSDLTNAVVDEVLPTENTAYHAHAEELLCPSCHASVVPGTKFCSSCGAPLKSEE